MTLLTCTFMPAMATDKVNDTPDLALLEYLAGLVEVDGELVGPMDISSQALTSEPDSSQVAEKTQQPSADKNPVKSASDGEDKTDD
ncbi:hypothetical protein [Thalassomonas actiniarum]|uniref:Uncharacterized protein n=1 Tax=Thalassomonas actiniarum TaxID=485447 RepID=A0AAE9YUR1_9GAMM|nr:hypothetical protein [Thalassomonas actiniarum]WDE00714.1 hypothetical protein SG35_008830 [Thalassomonas actiniarum]